VTVQPRLCRIGEVADDLDEIGTELAVEHVEVVGGALTPRFHEGEPALVGFRITLLATPHPGQLLGGDDGHHAGAPLARSAVQVGFHVVELAVIPTGAVGGRKAKHGDLVVLCESPHRRPEPVADLLEQRRGGHRIAEVVAQEVRDLAFPPGAC
jgi:hypothetical protein